jgi:hypothetical protein
MQWFVSHQGATIGPHDGQVLHAKIQEMVAAGQSLAGAYVRDEATSWVPIEQSPFASALHARPHATAQAAPVATTKRPWWKPTRGATLGGVLLLLFLVYRCGTREDRAQAAAASLANNAPTLATPQQQQQPTPEAAPTAKVAIIGDTVTLSDSQWTVMAAKNLGPHVKSGNQFVEDLKSEGAAYIGVVFKVTNLGTKEERIFGHPKLRDGLGREYSAHDRATVFLPKGKHSMQLEAVPAGLPKEFWAIYEVPANATGLHFMARELGMRARTYPIDLALESAAAAAPSAQ